jgi:hypothetical protein
MSEGNATINQERNLMKTWQVEYSAVYWVEAETEDEAIELAIESHADLPDGSWEAMIDPYDSNNFNTLGEK